MTRSCTLAQPDRDKDRWLMVVVEEEEEMEEEKGEEKEEEMVVGRNIASYDHAQT